MDISVWLQGCLIDSKCYTNRTSNPSLSCQICKTEITQYEWALNVTFKMSHYIYYNLKLMLLFDRQYIFYKFIWFSWFNGFHGLMVFIVLIVFSSMHYLFFY